MDIKTGTRSISRRSLPFTPKKVKLPVLPPALVKILSVLAVLAILPLAIVSQEGQRAVLAFCVFVYLLITLLYSPSVSIPTTLTFLAFLGGVRRWLIPFIGYRSFDPLLLVVPVLVFLYCADLMLRQRIPRDTRVSRMLPFFLLLMAVEIVNPLQGGLMIGLAGAMFYIVPLLWFYVGRINGGPTLVKRIFRVTIAIGLLSAIYGLFQTFVGFLPAEQEWMKLVDYGALKVNIDVTRAFSFFTSAAEYAHFLALSIVLLWAAFLRGHRLALIPIPLLGLALFLESSRSILVFALVSCTVLWAVQGKSYKLWIPRGVFALVLAIIGMIWSLRQVQAGSASGQVQILVAHQANGLLNPLDARHSTATSHAGLVTDGIVAGFRNPIGRGLGVTTLAANKFIEGNRNAQLESEGGYGNTEFDISNIFVSLGFVGGILYLAIIGFVMVMAGRYWHISRSLESLRILGLLTVELGQWLNGQHYAGGMLIWFCIGALDRQYRDVTQSREAAPNGEAAANAVAAQR